MLMPRRWTDIRVLVLVLVQDVYDIPDEQTSTQQSVSFHSFYEYALTATGSEYSNNDPVQHHGSHSRSIPQIYPRPSRFDSGHRSSRRQVAPTALLENASTPMATSEGASDVNADTVGAASIESSPPETSRPQVPFPAAHYPLRRHALGLEPK